MSILLDTNVLSELLRAEPQPQVLVWFAAQPAAQLWTSAVTEAEMLTGVRLLPAGRRRNALGAAVQAMFNQDFNRRVLPFDSAAADIYAEIVSQRRAAGRPVSQFDAQIAAIARQHGHALATRNSADFEGCGLVLLNPWQAAG